MIQTHHVTILNQKLTIRTDRDETYVRKAADFVNKKIEEVTNKTKTVSTLTATLLVCMNIADELFQSKKESEKNNLNTAEKVRSVISLIDSQMQESLVL